jgi:hypothetical protein
MRLPRVVLASFAGVHDVLHIRNRDQPVEALSEGFSDQRSWRRVVAANASVDVAEHLLPLLARHALL